MSDPRGVGLGAWAAVLAAVTASLALGACGRLGYEPMEHEGDGGPTAADGAPSADAGADAAGSDAAADAPAPPPPDAAPPPDAMPGAPDASTLPTGVVFTATTGTTVVGGVTTASFSDDCPPGQVVIGYDGGLFSGGVYLGSIQATCGIVSIDSSSGVPTLKVTPAGVLAEHGGTTVPTWSRHCGTDQMIFGFDGRSGSYVDQLTFVCLKLVVSGGPGSYGLSVSLSTALSPVGGTGGTAFAPERCPTGSVATGDRGFSGSYVDGFGLRCGTYALTY